MARTLSIVLLKSQIMDKDFKNSTDESVDQSTKTKTANVRFVLWMMIAINLILLCIVCSCSSSHKVMQSASTYKAGDSVVTTIIYQQSGSLKK